MKIKVCGIRDIEDMRQLDKMGISFIGINFYPASKRYYDGSHSLAKLQLQHAFKVGVFVDPSLDYLLHKAERHGLDFVQLHGNEPPSFCTQLHDRGIRMIKTFSGHQKPDPALLSAYDICDYFLLDSGTGNAGGSGKSFDWSGLHSFQSPRPWFLAGGIHEQHAIVLRELKNCPQLLGFDLNSGFENAPGIKDLTSISRFQKQLYEN